MLKHIWQVDGTFERLKNGKSRWRARPGRCVFSIVSGGVDENILI